ncbi:MAG: hypothetical protein OHK005_17030 [Candidatus Methylacidiphilales bacterium]
MKRTPSRSRLYGFSLVELLVVVTILGILVALAVPTIGMASARIKGLETTQRLRELQQANQLYANENGDRFVPLYAGPGPFELGWKWNLDYLRYLGLEEGDIGTDRWQAVMRSPFWDPTSAPHADLAYRSEADGFHRGHLENAGTLIAFIDATDWWVNPYAFADWPGPTSDGSGAVPAPAYRQVGRKAAAVTYAGNVIMLSQEDLNWREAHGYQRWFPSSTN